MAFTEKLKKFIRPRAFLFKLFLTILVFIFIPLLAIQIFVIERSTDEFKKSNQEYYFSALLSSNKTFESKEDLLSQTALRVSLNENVRKPLRHTANEYSLYEAAEALTGYGAEILHVKSVGVYYKTKGYLLTNGCKYTLQEYCEKIESVDLGQDLLQNVEWALKMEDYFNELVSMEYYATSDGTTLYVARPVSLGAVGRNDGIVFFAMDAKALEESYRAAVSLDASFAILSPKGEFLIRGEDFIANIDEKTVSHILSASDNVITAGAQGQLLVYRYVDQETGLVFLLSVDKDESQEQLMRFAQLIRMTMYIMLIIVAISLVVTIYINYLPIHKLLKKHANKDAEYEMYSEIERLDSAFFRLDRKNSTQQELLREFILGDLLFENEVNPDLVNQYFADGGYRNFVVLTAACPVLNAEQSRQLAVKISENFGCSTYVTSVPQRPHTVIICLSQNLIDPDRLFGCTVEAMLNLLGEKYLVHIGDIVTDIYELRASYRSAITTSVNPNDVESGLSDGEFSKKLQSLSQCVYVGDEKEALHQLDDIKHLLYTKAAGEGHLRYYGFKLLHAYLSGIHESKTELSPQEEERLLAFTNMNQLFKLLGESIHQVCNQVSDTERSVDVQMQKRLLQYVEAHLTSSELCLTTAADHIGTSIYAVSRLFKEVTGKGFKDYVTEKRLEYGHVLLTTTQKSIAEVSAESGFENANYFSTVFKQKYGVPPTKYRNIQKEKQQV